MPEANDRIPKELSSSMERGMADAYAKWMGAVVMLSWAHERPGRSSSAPKKVFEEEVVFARVKACKVFGRQDDDGSHDLSVTLDLDTDLYFAHDKVASVSVGEDEQKATVSFRSRPGIPSSHPKTVNIKRMA